MKYLKKLNDLISSKYITMILLNIAGICLIVYLGMLTSPFWLELLHKTWLVVKPFLVAFVLAFALEPLILFLDRRFHNRNLSVCITYIVLLIVIVLAVITVVPLFYNSIIETIPALTDGLDEIQVFVYKQFHYDISSLTSYIYATINDYFKSATVFNTTIDVLNQLLGKITNTLIYFILGIYLSSQFPNLKTMCKEFASKIEASSIPYLSKISDALIEYEKAFLISAVLQGVTCGIMYVVIGNNSWFLLGILAAFSSIFPYIGPVAANMVGLITSLNLGVNMIVILIILIFIQSTIMSYVITPRVYSTQTDLSILWVLFGILSGATLMGIWGMLIAMPLLVTIKAAITVYRKNNL